MVDEVVVLANGGFLIAEDDVDCLMLKVALYAHWQVVAVLFVETFSCFPLLLQDPLEDSAQSVKRYVVSFSAHELVDCLMVRFRKLAGYREDEAVIVEFVQEETQLVLLVFEFLSVLEELLSLRVDDVAVRADVLP